MESKGNLVEVIPRKKERVKGTEGGVLGGRMQQQRGLGSALGNWQKEEQGAF